MKNDQKCPGFVTLANGDAIRADTIFAAVAGDAEPAYPGSLTPLPWRVIVKYGSPTPAADGTHYSIVPCENMAARDEMIAAIMRAIKIALGAQSND